MANDPGGKRQQGSNSSRSDEYSEEQLSQESGTSEPSQHGSERKSRQQQQARPRDESLDVDEKASSPGGPSGSPA